MGFASVSYDHDVHISEIILYHLVADGRRDHLHSAFSDISSDHLSPFEHIFAYEEDDEDAAEDDEEFRNPRSSGKRPIGVVVVEFSYRLIPERSLS